MPTRPLIVRLRNWIGDVILGLPALQLLAEHGYELQLVGKPWSAGLFAGHPWPVTPRATTLRDRVAQLRQLRRAARDVDPEFDRRENALLLPHSFSAAMEARLAGLKAVGYAQEARSWLLARAEPITYGGHALTSYWELGCRFLRIQQTPPARIGLRTREADQQRADALIREHGLEGGFIAICPFAGGTFEKLDKKWPAFPAFARSLRQRGHRVVIVPGPGDEAVVREQYPHVTAIGGIDLGVYGGLLRRCSVMVSNDTGPAHLAAAVDATVLSVLGPTKPEQWAPWGTDVHLVKRWPGWPSVDEVMQRLQELMERR